RKVTQGAKNVGLRSRFNRFGHDLATNALDEFHDRLDDHTRLLGALNVLDQGRVKLHAINRQRSQASKVRIPCSEVVYRNARAVTAKSRNLGNDSVIRFYRSALGEFQLDG